MDSISGTSNMTPFSIISQMTNNMMQRLDTNKDKGLTVDEFGGGQDVFNSIDKNTDGKVDVVELNKAALTKVLDQQTSSLISSLDQNGDKLLSADELKLSADVFSTIDKDSSGTASMQELNDAFIAKQAASQYGQTMNSTSTTGTSLSSLVSSIVA